MTTISVAYLHSLQRQLPSGELLVRRIVLRLDQLAEAWPQTEAGAKATQKIAEQTQAFVENKGLDPGPAGKRTQAEAASVPIYWRQLAVGNGGSGTQAK